MSSQHDRIFAIEIIERIEKLILEGRLTLAQKVELKNEQRVLMSQYELSRQGSKFVMR